ncbi:DoxX family membrane protein [Propionibacteriaceae bacterium G1746]|uniref:DoxX family membrane protein n=1 Tax=Aestuariimicrobium sp. G57 TaxID=3418485 RepID=UPI003C1348EF
MSLLRFVGRAMLASHFVYEGVKAVTNPQDQLEAAEPVAQKVAPLAQRVAPAQFAPYVPQETKTLVQLWGAGRIFGGAAFATGIGRRLGAGVLLVTQVPHVIALALEFTRAGDEHKRAAQAKLLAAVALLGSTILAAQDHEGNPSLAWRAENTAERLGKAADKKAQAISKDAEKLSKRAKKEIKQAKKAARKQLDAA